MIILVLHKLQHYEQRHLGKEGNSSSIKTENKSKKKLSESPY